MIGPSELAFIVGLVILAIVGTSLRDWFVRYRDSDDRERPD